jgi:hypothetical protein
MRALWLSVVLAFGANFASAETLSGNELLDICSAKDDMAKFSFCIGYVNGIIGGLRYGAALPFIATGKPATEADALGQSILGYCAPEDVTLSQMVDITVLYLERNPASRHESVRPQIVAAFTEAFPCQ